MPIPKETVQLILNTIADTFLLGSANIGAITKSKSIHNDKIFVYASLFYRTNKQRRVNALIDGLLSDLPAERIGLYGLLVLEQVSAEYKKMTPLEIKQSYLTKKTESSVESMSGNCLDMCLFGLYFLNKNKQLVSGLAVEIMSFRKPLDHCVMVIRVPSVSIKDSKVHNDSMIILDPWLNLAMTREEFNTFWKKNFPIISSKSLSDFYAPKTYKTRHQRIPAETKISFELIKTYDLKDMDFVSPKFEKNSNLMSSLSI